MLWGGEKQDKKTTTTHDDSTWLSFAVLEWEGSASSRMSSMKSIKCKFHEFFWLILFSEES